MHMKKVYIVRNFEKNFFKVNQVNLILESLEKKEGEYSYIEEIKYEEFKHKKIEIAEQLELINKSKSIKNNIFKILIESLNAHHNLDKNEKYWQIILGHWFDRYCDLIINRVNLTRELIKNYEITGITGYEDGSYYLATLNSYDFIWASNDSRWNNQLLIKIINLIEPSIPIDKIQNRGAILYQWSNKFRRKRFQNHVKNYIFENYNSLLNYLGNKNDIFILNSYLGIFKELLLQLKLKQLPRINLEKTTLVTDKVDYDLRKYLCQKFNLKNSHETESIALNLLYELIPVCFLEGFNKLLADAENTKWIKNPKIIVTANNFDTDELFKTWTAEKVMRGSKYYVLQHGANYGTDFYRNPTVEEQVADKFITWGWCEDQTKHIKGYIIKTNSLHNFSASNKNLLLIEASPEHDNKLWDVNIIFESYINEQIKFYNNLNDNISRNIIIRLHNDYKNFNWDLVKIWRNINVNVKIDNGITRINNLVLNARLVVFSYDSTGILELLSKNIPIIIFWNNDMSHLRDSAKQYYGLLSNAGILHFNAQSAGNKVNEIWDNVPEWWSSKSIQEAVSKFTENYARLSKNPAYDLSQIIRDNY